MTVDFLVQALFSYVIERRLSVMLLYRDLGAFGSNDVVLSLVYCTSPVSVPAVSK